MSHINPSHDPSELPEEEGKELDKLIEDGDLNHDRQKEDEIQ